MPSGWFRPQPRFRSTFRAILMEVRDSSRRSATSSLSRIAVVALLPVALLSSAVNSDMPDFSGLWVEMDPAVGPPMRLQLNQSGSELQVRMSYRDTPPYSVFGVAAIENGAASWTLPQSCIARFQWPGYSYDNPGINRFSLSLRDPADPGQPGPLLVYVQETEWHVPCANNHPIGTERIEKILRRQ
jgi:hypothetical protein